MAAFADEASTTNIADLAIENGRTAVTISGDLVIRRDQAGLRHARDLKRVIDAIVSELAGVADLPAHLDDTKHGDTVANPFA